MDTGKIRIYCRQKLQPANTQSPVSLFKLLPQSSGSHRSENGEGGSKKVFVEKVLPTVLSLYMLRAWQFKQLHQPQYVKK